MVHPAPSPSSRLSSIFWCSAFGIGLGFVPGHGAVLALDPHTGEEKWRYEQFDVSDSGMLTTASDLLFTGGREGYFHALDARTGELLWKASLGGR